jgi:hypothetical protein
VGEFEVAISGGVWVAIRGQWQFGDDEWDLYEIEELLSFTSCECESEVVHVDGNCSPRYVCKKCNSNDLEFSNIGTSD